MDADTVLHLPGAAGDPRFSPDGQHLVYLEDDGVWVQSLHAPAESRRLGTGRAPGWHPDGASVTFLRVDGSRPRIWRQPLDLSSAATPISPEDVSVRDYTWSPDGRTLALLEAPGTPQNPLPGTLLLLDTVTGVAQQRLEFPVTEFPSRLSWSSDGRHLAWEVARLLEDRREATYEVQLLPVAGGPLRRVVPTGACQTRHPVWRPDSQGLALIATPHPYGFYALFGLATWSLRGGIARYLTRDPMIVHGAVCAPDGQTIYVSARHASITEHIYAINASDGSSRQLTHGLAHHAALTVAPDGQWLAYVVDAPDRLPEVWVMAADGSGTRQVSTANHRLADVAGLHMLESELIRWPSVDGLMLEGYLLYPPGYGPDHLPPTPLPTIVDLHGGPVDVAPRRTLGQPALWFTGLHELAEHGYLCFAADYRHTGTYGWRHIQRIVDSGEHIGLDAADILTGVDHIVMMGRADPTRLGLRGHSYGAYLANWLVTQSTRFRAAVSTEGPTDLMVFPEPNTIVQLQFGGAHEEVPEHYRRASPLTYAAQARTPVLLIEGELSPLIEEPKGVTHPQGAVFRDALAAAGVDVEYVQYPGEGHMIMRPDHQADYLHRMMAWFDRYLERPVVHTR